MEQGQLISVVIPVWKGKWLRDAIDSVLNQSYANLELVIVNDCSPDIVDEIVGQFDDERIRYYVNEHNIGGEDLAEAWNKCVSYAKGEWVCLLADDDAYKPDYLCDLLSLSAKYPQCDVFRSRVEILNKDNGFVDFFPSSPEYEPAEEYLWHVLKGYRRQTISEFMIRREAIIRHGGYVHCPLAWGSDYLSILQFSASFGIVTSNKVNTQYRDSGENISSNDDRYIVGKLKAIPFLYDKMDEWIMANASDFYKAVLLELTKTKRYDSKHWLLSEASFSGLHNVYTNRKKIEGVSGFVIIEHMILLVFRKVGTYFTGIYVFGKSFLRKMCKNRFRRMCIIK